MTGSVRVSRAFFGDTAFKAEPFTEREAFLWLIMEASFKAREKRVGKVVVRLERGQIAASIRFMQEAWGWKSKARVFRYLERLAARGMVRSSVSSLTGNRNASETASGTGVTVITLCKYDEYQSCANASETPPDDEPKRKRNASETNENKDEIREREKESKASFSARKRAKPKTRIPENAVLSERQRAVAVDHGLSDAEAEAQFVRFRDWALAKAQAYADWDAAWRNWVKSPHFRQLTGNITQFPRRQTHGERLDDEYAKLEARLAAKPFDG